MNQKLNTQPYKGSRDFYPEDIRVRNYIFDTWRMVCFKYGFEAYDGPFLEEFDLYAAKTGEEIVKNQLYWFEDKGGRKVAIRPETTPTLARMVAAKYKSLPRPIKWFTIQNMWRYEKPQKGRLREFFQLNVDILGVDGVEADFEVLSLSLDIMKAFGAKENMFEIRIGNRKLLDDVLKKFEIGTDKAVKVRQVIDRKSKVKETEFKEMLADVGLKEDQIKGLAGYLSDPDPVIRELLEEGSEGAAEIARLLEIFGLTENKNFVKFDPTVVRGLDYYTGNVFEQVDLNPKNTRSMYGGGRYDDLVSIFNGESLPAVGLAMGDVTLQNFLEDWKLMPEFTTHVEYLVTLWPSDNNIDSNAYFMRSLKVAEKLRSDTRWVEMWITPNTKLEKQLKYADKRDIENVVIIGETELKRNEVTIKNMETGDQETIPFSSL
jgi:histidyl-tRNA synthetase